MYTTHRFPIYAVLALLIAVTGCSEMPTASMSDDVEQLDSADIPVLARASSGTVNLQIPTAPIDPFVSCANGGLGETVVLEGTVHLQMHSTINQNGELVRMKINPQGVKGTGQITGTVYRGVGNTREITHTRTSSSASTYSFNNTFNIIGPGPGNNLKVHSVVHTTFNANDDPTASVNIDSIECF